MKAERKKESKNNLRWDICMQQQKEREMWTWGTEQKQHRNEYGKSMLLPTNKMEGKRFSPLVYFLRGTLGLSANNVKTAAPVSQEGSYIVGFCAVFKEIAL